MKKVHWKSIKKSLYIRYWVFRICAKLVAPHQCIWLSYEGLGKIGRKNEVLNWIPDSNFILKAFFSPFNFFLLGCSEKNACNDSWYCNRYLIYVYRATLLEGWFGVCYSPPEWLKLCFCICFSFRKMNTNFMLKSLYILWLSNRFLITAYKVNWKTRCYTGIYF